MIWIGIVIGIVVGIFAGFYIGGMMETGKTADLEAEIMLLEMELEKRGEKDGH